MKITLAVLSVVLTSLGLISVVYFFGSTVFEITSLEHYPNDEEMREIIAEQLAESLLILIAGILGVLISSLILIFNRYRVTNFWIWSL